MFSNLPSLEITKFCRPHHRKDVLVTVSWLDMETPNELLYHLFSHFGKVNSSIADCVYKKNEKDSDLASLLDGVRQFWMTVTTPLPSYGIIDGKRVKIFHVGQARTCACCHCTRDVCPGQANARQCEDNGGEKNLEDSHATLFSVVVVQVMGTLSDKGQLMRWFVETSMLVPQFPRITNSKMTSLGKYLSIVCFIFGCPKAAL